MKITKQHRECFKEALEYLGIETDWCCNAINFTSRRLQTKKECKRLLFYYFQDKPEREVLWLPFADSLNYEEALTCRLIALYTLIYAPL